MSRSRAFASLASNVDSTGTILPSGISASVDLDGIDVFDSVSLLPISGLTAGNQALVNDRLYITNGTGWYNVALINLSPSIDLGPDGADYTLDSTNTVSISLVASDSDGTPITWSFTTSDSATDLATITNDSDGSFNVTGKSLADILAAGYDSDGGSFTVTFRASDGISFDTDSASFTLTYTVAALIPDGDFSSFTNVLTVTGTDGANKFPYSGQSIYGDTVVFGEDRHSSMKGRVSVYTTSNNGDTWTLQQAIDNPDNSIDDGMFGRYVTVREDVMVVGAFTKTYNSVASAGRVMVYTRSGTTWSLQGYINSPDTSATLFGDGVKLDPVNGEYLVVGHRNASKAHVYKSTDGWSTWTGPVTIDPGGDGSISSFECGEAFPSVDIYDNTLIFNGTKTGSYANSCVAVYTTSDNGSTWGFQAELESPNEGDGGRMGYSSSIYGDIVVSGAYIAPDGGYQRGRVYAFTRTGSSWSAGSEILEPTANRSDSTRFGSMVVLSGNNLIIGKNDDGKAYLYRTSNGGSSWSLINTFTNSESKFGLRVYLYGDLASINDQSYSSSTGRVYLYKADALN